MKNKEETAVLAAGCFWGVQSIFDKIPGVTNTRVGYTGGKTENPSYNEVCSGKTGHAEAIEISFDSSKISYRDIVDIFWMNHNPTTLNQQGPDKGEQYRSAIFYIDEEQKKIALASKKDNQKNFSRPIVTEIVKFKKFYPAEEYHQKYYLKHKINCHINLKK